MVTWYLTIYKGNKIAECYNHDLLRRPQYMASKPWNSEQRRRYSHCSWL